MSYTMPTPNAAYKICYWIDKGAAGNPPSPYVVAWQPRAHKNNYACVLASQNSYVLVIQGTQNAWDALLDFGVDSQPEFEPISGSAIAIGGKAGLLALLADVNEQGQTLYSFLRETVFAKGSSNGLFVTGHSLGGALTSVLAPWISYEFLAGRKPISSLPEQISAMTFAAFALGNETFAGFWNAQKSTQFQAFFNENDVVPYVWANTGRFSVPNMYKLFPDPGPNPIPGNFETLVQNKVNKMGPGVSYSQVTNFKSFNLGTIKAKGLTPDLRWLYELNYQHNDVYAMQFGIGTQAASMHEAKSA